MFDAERPAKECQLVHEFVQERPEAVPSLPVCGGYRFLLAEGLDDQVDRAVLKVQTRAVRGGGGNRPAHLLLTRRS